MGAKILIVDDSKMILNIHSSMLEAGGHICVKAENGSIALELLIKDDFDMVITDINMPRMGGYELTKKIREIDQYVETPIIMISTEREVEDQEKGFDAGGNVYIVKPVQKEELLTNVNMLLQNEKK